MKNNRKGFTTVELVIVIAVIAILAAVLIPTFSNLITKANESAALQEVKAAYNVYLSDSLTDDNTETPIKDLYVVHENNTIIHVVNGQATVVKSTPSNSTEMDIVAHSNSVDKTLCQYVKTSDADTKCKNCGGAAH